MPLEDVSGKHGDRARMSVESPTDGRTALSHILVTQNGESMKILLSEVLGISFTLRSDLMCEKVEARVVIVLKKPPYPTRHWKKWLLLSMRLTLYFCSVLYLLGPFSALILVVLMLLVVLLSARRVGRRHSWRDNTVEPSANPNKNPLTEMQISLPAFFSAITGGPCFAAGLLFVIRRAISKTSVSSYLPFCNFENTPYAVMVAVLLAALTCSFHPRIRGSVYPIFGLIYRSLAFPVLLPLPPFHHAPIVVDFEEENIAELVQLRSQCYGSSLIRPYLLSYWVGNAATESCMSFCLPSTAYNSLLFRNFLFISFHYIIPIYSVARGLGALMPHAEMLSPRFRTDIGLNILAKLVEHYYKATKLRLWEQLYRARALLPPDFYGVSAASRYLEAASSHVLPPINYINNFIFQYILPNNIYIQYVQSRFGLLQVGARPLIHSLCELFLSVYQCAISVFASLKTGAMQAVVLAGSVLVQPMPSPGVVQVASTVVSGSSRLASAMKSPAKNAQYVSYIDEAETTDTHDNSAERGGGSPCEGEAQFEDCCSCEFDNTSVMANLNTH